jgi:hypothetical protein
MHEVKGCWVDVTHVPSSSSWFSGEIGHHVDRGEDAEIKLVLAAGSTSCQLRVGLYRIWRPQYLPSRFELNQEW